MSKTIWLLLGCGLAAGDLAAATAVELVTYRAPYEGGTGCVTPRAVTSFTVRDKVHVYFVVRGVAEGERLEYLWRNLDTQEAPWAHRWTQESAGNWCYPHFYAEGESLGPGRWRVEAWSNQVKLMDSAPFVITPGPTTTSTPNYDGYFDPIATDCSHLNGWAIDRNNPAAQVRVDLVVSGYPTVTVTANEPRSDLTGPLTGRAWNKYDLQPYLTGTPVTVNAYFAGTTRHLPGSPRTLPPDGALPGPCRISPRGPVAPPTPPVNRELRLYSSSPANSLGSAPLAQLRDFFVIMDKTRVSSTRFKYEIYVLSDGLDRQLQAASLAVVVPETMDLDPNSFRAERSVNIPGGGQKNNVIAGINRGWEDLSVLAPEFEGKDKAETAVKNTLFGLGGLVAVPKQLSNGLGIANIFGDLIGDWISLHREIHGVFPAVDLSLRVQDINRFDTHTMTALRLKDGFFDLAYGVRFTFVADEQSGDVPWFYLKANNEDGEFIGVEIKANRSAPRVCRSGGGCS